MPFSNAGIADPESLSLLRDVLDSYSARHPLADREMVAAELLAGYRAGAKDEVALLDHLSRVAHLREG